MSGGRRSLQYPNNPGQGSAFHELVVVPTLAPQLARPYHIPGSSIVIDPLLPSDMQPGSNDTPVLPNANDSAAMSNNGDDFDDRPVPRLFSIHVTLEWSERQKSARPNARAKKCHESKFVSKAMDILSMSRTRIAFIPVALGAHGYENVYVAGVASGPAMRFFWTGGHYQQLRPATNSSKKLDTVSVLFDLDGMEGFKQRKRIHSPDPYDSELSYGTRVPNSSNCTPAQIALGSAIEEIKGAHSCVQHGTCFIDGDLRHLEMNRFRLNMWGHAVTAGQCAPEDPPPKQILDAWTGGASGLASTSKPRGRTGPHALQPAPASTSASDMILTSMVPVMAMLAQNMAQSAAPVPVHRVAAPRSPTPPSSPPPAIEDDLDIFLDEFRRAKKIPDSIIDSAKERLRGGRYTPDIIAEPSVTAERLQELTGLAEGEVHQLKKFARQWSGKVEGKRVRCGILF
ncbi:hypothetical protein B0H13DRAFT_2453062 [Mycena leptocephala]|nr:hypothetical protein B0H13DRAFT_2453062 [Mycena leptocephala]